ncbi:MAG: hypothetical protein AAGF88_03940 [Pseudomonadota bacterium]
MTLYRNLTAFTMGAMLLAGASVQAQDFSITVPVEISNLTANDVAQVTCWVSDEFVTEPWDEPNETGVRVLAMGHVDVPVAAGEFVQTQVTVTFAADPPEVASEAQHFGCALSFRSAVVAGSPVMTWEECILFELDPTEQITTCGPRDVDIRGTVYGEL